MSVSAETAAGTSNQMKTIGDTGMMAIEMIAQPSTVAVGQRVPHQSRAWINRRAIMTTAR